MRSTELDSVMIFVQILQTGQSAERPMTMVWRCLLPLVNYLADDLFRPGRELDRLSDGSPRIWTMLNAMPAIESSLGVC